MAHSTVSTYHWQNSSITEVTVSGSGKGCKVTLAAANEIGAGMLADLPARLKQAGLGDYKDAVANGTNLMVAEKIADRDIPKLINFLKEQGVVRGEAQTSVREEQSTQTAWQKVQEQALELNGRIGLVGHAALFARGILLRNWNQVAQGPLGAAVPIILGLCGNGQEGRNHDEVVAQMREYLTREGVPFPPATEETHKKNLVETAQHFIATHPTLVAGAFGLLGSYQGVKAGMEDGIPIRAVAAGVTGAGTIAMMAVPEKETAEEVSPFKKIADGAKHIGGAMLKPWTLPQAIGEEIQKGPTMFMGLTNLSDNGLYGAALWKEYANFRDARQNEAGTRAILEEKRGQLAAFTATPHDDLNRGQLKQKNKLSMQVDQLDKQLKNSVDNPMVGAAAIALSAITLVSWAAASALASISSKNASARQQQESTDKLYTAMAKLVVHVPEQDRGHLLDRMAQFLSTRAEVPLAQRVSDTIASEIGKRVEVMKESPWVARMQQATTGPTAPGLA